SRLRQPHWSRPPCRLSGFRADHAGAGSAAVSHADPSSTAAEINIGSGGPGTDVVDRQAHINVPWPGELINTSYGQISFNLRKDAPRPCKIQRDRIPKIPAIQRCKAQLSLKLVDNVGGIRQRPVLLACQWSGPVASQVCAGDVRNFKLVELK